MHVLLTSYQRLAAIYAADTPERVRRRLEALCLARAGRGLASQVLALEEGWPARGVGAARLDDWATVHELVWAIAAALEAHGDALESLLLVGGPEIVPVADCANLFADAPEILPSDYLYGVRVAEDLLLSWPVARLPGARSSPRPLLQLLAQAARLQQHIPAATGRAFGYSAAAWLPAAEAAFAALPYGGRPLVSPPLQAYTLDLQLLNGADRVYLNLHGVQDGPYLYGQTHGRPTRLVLALRPADLDQLRLDGALVISEACYGANLMRYDAADGFALRFLLRGAAAYIGATAITYGPVAPPLADADLLAYHLLQAAEAPGASVGTAFLEARRALLRDTIQAQGFIDEELARTLIQFVLYGDPTLPIGRTTD